MLRSFWLDVIWAGGIAATPVALIAAILCSTRRVRPATRHALALAALVSFLSPALVGAIGRPDWLTAVRRAMPGQADATGAKTASLDAAVAVKGSPRDPTQHAAPIATPRPLASDLDPCVAETTLAAATPSCASACRDDATSADESDQQEAPSCGATTTACDTSCASIPASVANDCREPFPLPSVAEAHATNVAGAFGLGGVKPIAMLGADDSPAETPAPGHAAAPFLPSSVTASITNGVERLEAVRDAITALPPMPLALWLCGSFVLVFFAIVRTVRARSILGRARPAPRELVAAVHDASRSLGLTAAPVTLVTDARISPMVWCGWTPKLIVPTELWNSLDEPSRRAVLVHELAHVSRGDHRWCWLEMFIVAAYWWHPLVWWLRRRLRDDSELCCDAWVTALMPTSRRAYAEALVSATEFLALPPRSSLATVVVGLVGLGFVPASPSRPSKRIAQRLARRITMVMTDRTTPRLSVLGALVTIAALGLGAFVTPSIACPPEQQAEKRVRVTVRQQQPRAVAGQPIRSDEVFVGEAPAIDAMGGPAQQAAAEREYAIARGQPIGGGLAGGANSGGLFQVAGAPMAPIAVAGFPADQRGEFTRAYYLPEGKLEALVELMSRQDVPIFIDAEDDHIVVHGDARQHEIFGAFVRLISPETTNSQPRAAQPARRPLQRTGPQSDALRMRTDALNRNRAMVLDLQRAREDHARYATEMQAAAEAAREQAESVRESAMALEEQARAARDPQAAQALAGALRALNERAASLNRDANQKSASMQSVEARLRQLEAQLQAAEARLEQLGERLESGDEDPFVENSIFVEGGPMAEEPAEIEDDEAIADDVAPAAAAGEAKPAPALAPAPASAPVARMVRPAPLPPLPAVPPVPPVAPVPPAPSNAG
ncbi:MAG: M56 family metallopeptidase [Phycisphaerales bacterium]